MKAKILNLEEACELYDLIGEFFPKEPTRAIDAIHGMMVKMGGEKYVRCLEILTGENKDVLIGADKNERLSVFLTAWEQNKLFLLPRLKQDGLCDR